MCQFPLFSEVILNAYLFYLFLITVGTGGGRSYSKSLLSLQIEPSGCLFTVMEDVLSKYSGLNHHAHYNSSRILSSGKFGLAQTQFLRKLMNVSSPWWAIWSTNPVCNISTANMQENKWFSVWIWWWRCNENGKTPRSNDCLSGQTGRQLYCVELFE